MTHDNNPRTAMPISEEVFFHVGMSKTGTTSLQNKYLARHPYLVNIGKPEFGGDERFLNFRVSVMKADESDFDASYWAATLSEALEDHRKGGCKFIFSEENFTNDSMTQERSARRLKQVFPNARIILTLREQREWLKSRYFDYLRKDLMRATQNMSSLSDWIDYQFALKKAAKNNVIDGLDFMKTVNLYDELFSAQKTCILLYEDFSEDPEDYFTQLADVLGVPVEQFHALIDDAAEQRERQRMSERRARYLQWRIFPQLRRVWQLLPSSFRDIVRQRIDSGKRAEGSFTAEQDARIRRLLGGINRCIAERMHRDLAKLGYVLDRPMTSD